MTTNIYCYAGPHNSPALRLPSNTEWPKVW